MMSASLIRPSLYYYCARPRCYTGRMIILLHSSKTMRHPAPAAGATVRRPQLLAQAKLLHAHAAGLSVEQIAKVMHVSPALAAKTQAQIAGWHSEPARQSLALDSFVGDIYSGLRAGGLSPADRDYADTTLRILSGLYGILRPYDGICPYRLEMGYTLPAPIGSLYSFWGRTIADCLPADGLIINTSSVEYATTITPYVDAARIITPRFLTVDPHTQEPAFVVVHAKIARGAFARWLIVNRATNAAELLRFTDLGYSFEPAMSTPGEPVFVCREFGGKGLSVRLR